LVEEKTRSDKVYVLKTGSVSIMVGNREVHVENEPGTFFGEISVLLNQDRSATVVAREPCVFHVIDDLPVFLQANPSVAFRIAQVLGLRVVKLHQALYDLKKEALALVARQGKSAKRQDSRLRRVIAALEPFTDYDVFHPLRAMRQRR
jgi:CRP-like cAMP-binding protein